MERSFRFFSTIPSTAVDFARKFAAPSAVFVHRDSPPDLRTYVLSWLQTPQLGETCPTTAFPHALKPVRRPGFTTPLMAQPAQALATAPIPPQNLDAEESVLGAMMLSAAAIEAVSEIIDAGDFYRESHAKIYRAALDLYQHGQPVDAITVADKLDERGELDEVGGKERVHEIAALVPGDLERAPLREDRPRDGDAPRADARRRADPAARLGPPGRDARARRPGRADGLRPRPAPHPRHASTTSRCSSARASSRSRRCTSRAAR